MVFRFCAVMGRGCGQLLGVKDGVDRGRVIDRLVMPAAQVGAVAGGLQRRLPATT